MNGLALRISRGSDSKSKKAIGYAPVNIPVSIKSDQHHELFQNFVDAASTDEQLPLFKKIVDLYNDATDRDVVSFMAVVFLHADAKHPVKCFIMRHVTKNSNLQEPFTSELALQISAIISTVPSHYKQYVDVVSKVAACIENFNAGVAAVKLLEMELVDYLNKCLDFCDDILGEKPLSPTEKNEIFNLCHLALRLLLHIVQKASSDSLNKMIPMFCEIRFSIDQLMYDNDVPMDTKSVCGILYLYMYTIENGPNSWIDVLTPATSNQPLLNLLKAEASQLCLFSAIATVVSAEKLEAVCVNGNPAILTLLNKIMEIGERSSLESTMILGVARSIHQMSKCLEKIKYKHTGLSLVDSLVMFAWSHLEHYMDSVRHLTAQMLAIVVHYCAKLDRDGDDTALSKVLSALKALDTSRKSYYVSLTCLVNELGAKRILYTWPSLIQDVLVALSSQHIQASAITALETLVASHAKSCSTEELVSSWLQPILSHVAKSSPDCAVINILENLLVTAVKLNRPLIKYIIPYIKQSNETTSNIDLKCVLMLLSVTHKSGVSDKLPAFGGEDEWKGVISYDVLKQAAIDAVDETRILSLLLIVESPKSTEEFTAGDLAFVLWYLKYNINAQAPNFRQLTLSCMKKFVKRLEDSYKVIKRQKESNAIKNKIECYLRFVDKVREQCFDSLLPGTNYSRRTVALQLLLWTQRLHLPGYTQVWTPDYVEKLLLHLEDSYENNKVLALEVLDGCPLDLLKDNTYSVSIDLKDILEQASSLKPTDCVSAAYKLDLLHRKMPECIGHNVQCSPVESAWYSLLVQVWSALRGELLVCRESVVLAARDGPMYGLLHCATHALHHVDPRSISSDPLWTSLVSDIITTCMEVNDSVSCVVNNSSPEGHLPMDMSGVVVTDEGNSGGVKLDDGRQVSAQMVLLCAWRSVKEVSLLLGLISSRLTIAGEDSEEGTLSVGQLSQIGEHFTTLLAETKHRGAFEQAYVGFTKLLARLWRCRNPELHSLPPSWLQELTRDLARGGGGRALCATRRSAGLPFMIQALVTTELQVQSNPKCFHGCMSSLLEVARTSSCVESRSHALNILRALFRHSALDESVAPYVEEGLLVALQGFEGDTWQERNSSTLLLSALVVRVFGVARSRGPASLSHRNTMTGRIFFLRYPRLYDFMLAKLQEVTSSENAQLVRPSLYPVLLLLGRLYPSSLEGTVSNLKLASFIPHVLSCARSSVLWVRELAARAMAPLVTPLMYFTHIQSMFDLLKRPIKRNYCHGILLQLVPMLENKPEGLQLPQFCEEDTLQVCVENTMWILEPFTTDKPCYLIADVYMKVINLLALRFPSLLREVTISKILLRLDCLIFLNQTQSVFAGGPVSLSNATYLYFILINNDIENSCNLIVKTLQHSCYEVVLSALNYLLILHDSLDEDMCKFQERLSSIANKKILDTLKRKDKYVQILCKVLNNKYLECQQKSLKILTLKGDTQRCIIQTRIGRGLNLTESILDHLLECVRNERDTLTHMYLESLLDYVTNKLRDNTICAKEMLEIVRVVFEHSSSNNNDNTRNAVVRFIERNMKLLLYCNIMGANEEQKFEFKATMWCTIIILLEDDNCTIRQRITDSVTSFRTMTTRILPSACAQYIKDYIEGDGDSAALFALIALLDFKSVVLTDDGNDEIRVFDQNERYNIFLEETIWSSMCADEILKFSRATLTPLDHIALIVDNPLYKGTFEKLCNDNLVLFKRMVNGEIISRNDAVNPKIQLFVNKLRI